MDSIETHIAKDREELAKAATSGDIRTNPGISVKLSALHPRYEVAKRARVMEELVPRVRALAGLAKAAGLGFNIDAEEQDRLVLQPQPMLRWFLQCWCKQKHKVVRLIGHTIGLQALWHLQPSRQK